MKSKLYKLLPWLSIAIIFVPLVILSFFNHPSADDYSYATALKDGQFYERYMQLYLSWQGRYSSTIPGMGVSYFELHYNIYWLHPIIIFILTIFSIHFLLTQLLKHFFKKSLSFQLRMLLSCALFFLMLYAQFSVAEGFYWFSAVFVYHFSIICLLLWSGCFTSFCCNAKRKKLYFIFLAILSFIICGSNELIAIALFLFTGIIWLLQYQLKNKKSSANIIFLIVFIAMALEIFSPGSLKRSSVIGEKDILKIVTSICYWGGNVYLQIIKEPLWWFAMIASVISGIRFTSIVHTKIRNNKCLYAFLISFPFIIIAPILYGSNGSIPLRMLNSVVSIQIFFLLLTGFLAGSLITNNELSNFINAFKPKPVYFYLLLTVLIPATTFTTTLYENLLQGFFYHKMMTTNEILKKTKDPAYKEKVIRDYSTYAIQAVKEYPFLNKELFIQKIQKPPSLIFFNNDFASDETESNFLNSYYK